MRDKGQAQPADGGQLPRARGQRDGLAVFAFALEHPSRPGKRGRRTADGEITPVVAEFRQHPAGRVIPVQGQQVARPRVGQMRHRQANLVGLGFAQGGIWGDPVIPPSFTLHNGQRHIGSTANNADAQYILICKQNYPVRFQFFTPIRRICNMVLESTQSKVIGGLK